MAVIGKPAPLKPWELDLIGQCRVARLATVSLGGQPHLVPVCFAFVDGAFFVPIDEKPKRGTTLARVQNIERDPRATLLIDHYADDWSQLAWLRFDCGAAVLSSGSERPDVVTELRRRYLQYQDMALEARPLIALTPAHHAAWRWSG